MPPKILDGQVITETVIAVESWTTGATIGSFQEDYPLGEADFVRLKTGKPITLSWAGNVFLTALGFGLGLIPKVLPLLAGKNVEVTKWEGWTFALGVLVAVTLWIIGCFLPNDRKRVMKNIEDHFKGAVRSRQIIRGQE